MVVVHTKRKSNGFSSKSKQSKQVGKKVVHDEVHHQPQAVAFTEEWYAAHAKIVDALCLYRKLVKDENFLADLSEKYGQKPDGRKKSGFGLHMRAAKLVKHSGKCVNTVKRTGSVLGVEVGDEFHWRAELSIVGLHPEFQKGIDYTKTSNGKVVATSIVDSGRYDNRNTPDTLTYCGEGENPNLDMGRKHKDQELTCGNLALLYSMTLKMPVRVIRKINCGNGSKQFSNSVAAAVNANHCGYKFVYDGLYYVTRCWSEKGKLGTDVYKFLLKRTHDVEP